MSKSHTWYHHPRCQQRDFSWNLRNFKVVTWHYQCHHHHKNNCIWYNLLSCLLFCRQIQTFNFGTIQYGRQTRHKAILEAVFNILAFQNGCHFGIATSFLTVSDTGRWIYQQNSHANFRYFEYFIDAIASIYIYMDPMPSSMMPWIRIYISIPTIPRYIRTTSVLMISSFVFQLSWKLFLFHL